MEKNLNNIDLFALMERENGSLVYDGPEGAIVQDAEKSTFLTDILDGDALCRILRPLAQGEVHTVVVKSRSAQQAVSAAFGLDGKDFCTQWVYAPSEPPAVPAFDIRPLELCHAKQAAAHYHLFEDTGPYLTSRIAAGRMWGLFDGGRLAGFVGTHSEGSMGLLEVFPEFRRKGYGLALEQYLIAWHLSRGWTPFGHVIDGNEASICLQKKAGMVCAGLPTIWLY